MTNNWVDPEAKAEAERYDNPIPSRTLILTTLEQLQTAKSHAELVDHFNLPDQKSIDALNHRLSAMVRDGQLMKDGFKYQPATDLPTHEATVYINSKGLGTANIAGHDDVLLPERELRLVFNGDRVKVRQTSVDRKGKPWGFITEVVQRRVKQIIGKVAEHEGEYFIQPSNPNQHQPITLEKELIEHANAKVGDMLRVAIDDYPTREELATGHVVQSMADKADTEIIIPQTILEFGLPYEFPEAVIKEAESFKEPSEQDIKGRVDLRDLPLVTIDGEDARDFDDAVYAEKRSGGGYRVVVAIADVSHYVRLDSPLNEEAEERGTSVYFPHFVLPMLPEALSNGLCSLNPHVDRLCMVCDLKLSRAGKVTGYEFYPAVMHSKARLTYTQVGQYFEGVTDAIPEDKTIHKSLNTLFQLYQTLKELRAKRHAMEFETIETYMTFDELGGIKEILPRSRNDAHKLIEECMLLANVAAAEYALEHDIPMLYRVHEAPEFSRIQKVRDFVKLLGLPFPEQPTQADYQRVIEATKDRLDAPSIHAVLLRSMMQAYYGAKNSGHYGLAYEAYTGMSAIDRARLADIQAQQATEQRGMRESILGQARQRGMGGSGMELAAQLQAQQEGANLASRQGTDVAAQAQMAAQQAALQRAQLGGSMQDASFDRQAMTSQAQDAINRFNTENQNTATARNLELRQALSGQNTMNRNLTNQQNVDLRNQSQLYNVTQKPVQQFGMESGRNQAAAGLLSGSAGMQQQGQQTQYGATMGLLGAGVQGLGTYMGGRATGNAITAAANQNNTRMT